MFKSVIAVLFSVSALLLPGCSSWKALVSHTDKDIFYIIVTLLGGVWALYQWGQSNKIKRAEFTSQFVEKLRSDKSIAEIYHLNDYGKNWYCQGFHGSKIEARIDQFFSFLPYICYLREEKMLREKEFCFFEYSIKSVCSNKDASRYLWNIYHFAHETRKSSCSFENLINYGLENKLLPNDFKDPEKEDFQEYKYLEF